MAARCSAISSDSAALDLEERSAGETQESALDDRRERARPVGNDKYGPVNLAGEEIYLRSFFLTSPSFQS